MSRTRLCEICKKPIDVDRTDGVPDTRLCGDHAIEIQKYGGEFIVTAEQERTSKAGSLKLNYGAVSTSKSRNHSAMDQLRDAYSRRNEKTS